ncbi:unnamed protein product, partial [Ectocarpus fasciculatus]
LRGRRGRSHQARPQHAHDGGRLRPAGGGQDAHPQPLLGALQGRPVRRERCGDDEDRAPGREGGGLRAKPGGRVVGPSGAAR